MLFCLINSTNIEVVEHAIKLFATLVLANPKLKVIIAKSKGFEILSHRLSNKVPFFSFLFYLEMNSVQVIDSNSLLFDRKGKLMIFLLFLIGIHPRRKNKETSTL